MISIGEVVSRPSEGCVRLLVILLIFTGLCIGSPMVLLLRGVVVQCLRPDGGFERNCILMKLCLALGTKIDQDETEYEHKTDQANKCKNDAGSNFVV